MSVPRSRTSWIMRLMGAESGLSTARMRSRATMPPKPMFTSFKPAASSLDVLDLFPDLLDLGFDIYHHMGDGGILAF